MLAGVVRHAHALAKNLAYGDQRRLEIARALAGEPQMILLDEPAAGLNPTEALEIAGDLCIYTNQHHTVETL